MEAWEGLQQRGIFFGMVGTHWEFPKIRGTLFGVLIIRILLFRVLCWGPFMFGTPPPSQVG